MQVDTPGAEKPHARRQEAEPPRAEPPSAAFARAPRSACDGDPAQRVTSLAKLVHGEAKLVHGERNGVPSIKPIRRATLAAPIVLICALALSACGSSTTTEAPDPATVVPSSAPLYVSAVVQPEGTLKRNATADAKKLTHISDPFGRLVQALGGFAHIGSFDYSKEVKPWLGRNAGVFATATGPLASAGESMLGSLTQASTPEGLLKGAVEALVSQGSVQGALVLDTTDVGKARAFLDNLAKRQGAHAASYRGVSYEVAPGGSAEAIVGKFAVIGTEEAVKSTIDTHAGGPSLAKGAQPYETLAAKTPAETLISAYLDLAATPSKGSSAGALLQLVPGQPTQMLVSLQPQKGSVALDADALSASAEGHSEASASAASAAALVAKLPAGSWLAAGFSASGKHFAGYLSAMRSAISLAASSVLSSFGGEAIETLFDRLSKHSAVLQAAFSGWNGPVAAYASGAGLLELQAGLVAESSSPARAVGAVSELATALASAGATVGTTTIAGAESAIEVHLTGFPLTIDVGAGNGLLAIGAGPNSVQAVLLPSGETLSQSPLYKSASAQLGSGAKPILIFDFPSMLAFVEGLGLGGSPSLSSVLPYLRSLGTLTASEQSLGGNVSRLHAVLQLQG